jgi:hypothetical protein
MTIDEAIEHAKEVARTCDDFQCAADHTQLAKWLRQARGADEAGKWYTSKIRELEVENAKLRKLARGLNWCTENAKMPSAECEYCPLGDAGYGELSCERLMRELRIEAES